MDFKIMSERTRLERVLGRKIIGLVPPYSRRVYEFCVRYVDRFNGDNNADPGTNGEYLFLRNELARYPDGVVFDIGANVGNWSSSALRISSRVNLHCFEPSKITFDKLSRIGWPRNVRLNNVALGETEELLTLHVVDDASGLNSIHFRRGLQDTNTTKTEEISVISGDAYCRQNNISRIDLMKVDVEGHELAVFKGMRSMLSKGLVGAIQFEYGGCNLDAKVSLGDLWDLLESHGFAFFKLFPDGPRRIERYRPNLDTFKYSNWVAIHESRKFA